MEDKHRSFFNQREYISPEEQHFYIFELKLSARGNDLTSLVTGASEEDLVVNARSSSRTIEMMTYLLSQEFLSEVDIDKLGQTVVNADELRHDLFMSLCGELRDITTPATFEIYEQMLIERGCTILDTATRQYTPDGIVTLQRVPCILDFKAGDGSVYNYKSKAAIYHNGWASHVIGCKSYTVIFAMPRSNEILRVIHNCPRQVKVDLEGVANSVARRMSRKDIKTDTIKLLGLLVTKAYYKYGNNPTFEKRVRVTRDHISIIEHTKLSTPDIYAAVTNPKLNFNLLNILKSAGTSATTIIENLFLSCSLNLLNDKTFFDEIIEVWTVLSTNPDLSPLLADAMKKSEFIKSVRDYAKTRNDSMMLYKIHQFRQYRDSEMERLITDDVAAIKKKTIVPTKKVSLSDKIKNQYKTITTDEEYVMEHSMDSSPCYAGLLPTSFVALPEGGSDANSKRVMNIIIPFAQAVFRNGEAPVSIERSSHLIDGYEDDVVEKVTTNKVVYFRENIDAVESELAFISNLFHGWTQHGVQQLSTVSEKTDEQLEPDQTLSNLIKSHDAKRLTARYLDKECVYIAGNQILLGRSINKEIKKENRKVVRSACNKWYNKFSEYAGINIKKQPTKILTGDQHGRAKRLNPCCAACRLDLDFIEDHLETLCEDIRPRNSQFVDLLNIVKEKLTRTIPAVKDNWDKYEKVASNLSIFDVMENMSTLFRNAISVSIHAKSDRLALVHSASTDVVMLVYHTSSILKETNNLVYQFIKIYDAKDITRPGAAKSAFIMDSLNFSATVITGNHVIAISKPFRLNLIRADRMAKSFTSFIISTSILMNTGNKFSQSYLEDTNTKSYITTSLIGALSYTKGINYIVGNAQHMASLAMALVSPIEDFIKTKYVYGCKSIFDGILNKRLIDTIDSILENDPLSLDKQKDIEFDEDDDVNIGGAQEISIRSYISGLIMRDAGDITNEINVLTYMASKGMHNRPQMLRKLVEVPIELEEELKAITEENGGMVLDPKGGNTGYTMKTYKFLISAESYMRETCDVTGPSIRDFLDQQSKFSSSIVEIDTMTKDRSTVRVAMTNGRKVRQGLFLEDIPSTKMDTMRGKAKDAAMLGFSKQIKKPPDISLQVQNIGEDGSLLGPLKPEVIAPYLSGRLKSYIKATSHEVRDAVGMSLTSVERKEAKGASVDSITDHLVKYMARQNPSPITPHIMMFDKMQRTGTDREIYMQQLHTKVMTYSLDQLANAASQGNPAEMIHIPGREKIHKIQKELHKMLLIRHNYNKNIDSDWKIDTANLAIDQTKFSAKDNSIKMIFLILTYPFLTALEKLKYSAMMMLYMEKQIVIPDHVMMMAIRKHDLCESNGIHDDSLIGKATNQYQTNHFKVTYNWLQGNFNYMGSYCCVITQNYITKCLSKHLEQIAKDKGVEYDSSMFFRNVDFSHSDDGMRTIVYAAPSSVIEDINMRYGSYCGLLLYVVSKIQMDFSLNLSISKSYADKTATEFLSEMMISGDLLPCTARYLNSLLAPTSFSSPAEDLASRIGSLQTAVREGLPPEIYYPILTMANYTSYKPYHMLPGERNDPMRAIRVSGIGADRTSLPIALGGYCIIDQDVLAVLGYRAADLIPMLDQISKRIYAVPLSQRNEVLDLLYSTSRESAETFIQHMENIRPFDRDSYKLMSILRGLDVSEEDYFNTSGIPGASGISLFSMPNLIKTTNKLKLMERQFYIDTITHKNNERYYIDIAAKNPAEVMSSTKDPVAFCAKQMLVLKQSGSKRDTVGHSSIAKQYITSYTSTLKIFMPAAAELAMIRANVSSSLASYAHDTIPLSDSIIREITSDYLNFCAAMKYKYGMRGQSMAKLSELMDDEDRHYLAHYETLIKEHKQFRENLRKSSVVSSDEAEIYEAILTLGHEYDIKCKELQNSEIPFMETKLNMCELLTYVLIRGNQRAEMNAKIDMIQYVREVMMNDVKGRLVYQMIYESVRLPGIFQGIRKLYKVDVTRTEMPFSMNINDLCIAAITSDMSALRNSGNNDDVIEMETKMILQIAESCGVYKSIVEAQDFLLKYRNDRENSKRFNILDKIPYRNVAFVQPITYKTEKPEDDATFDRYAEYEVELMKDYDFESDLAGIELEVVYDTPKELTWAEEVEEEENMQAEMSNLEVDVPDVPEEISIRVILGRCLQLARFLANMVQLYSGRSTYMMFRSKPDRTTKGQLATIASNSQISGGALHMKIDSSKITTVSSRNILSVGMQTKRLMDYVNAAAIAIREFEALVFPNIPSKTEYLSLLNETQLSGSSTYNAISSNIAQIQAEPNKFIKFLPFLIHLGMISPLTLDTVMDDKAVHHIWGLPQKQSKGPYDVMYIGWGSAMRVIGYDNTIDEIEYHGVMPNSSDPQSVLAYNALLGSAMSDIKPSFKDIPVKSRVGDIFMMRARNKYNKIFQFSQVHPDWTIDPNRVVEDKGKYYGNIQVKYYPKLQISNMVVPYFLVPELTNPKTASILEIFLFESTSITPLTKMQGNTKIGVFEEESVPYTVPGANDVMFPGSRAFYTSMLNRAKRDLVFTGMGVLSQLINGVSLGSWLTMSLSPRSAIYVDLPNPKELLESLGIESESIAYFKPDTIDSMRGLTIDYSRFSSRRLSAIAQRAAMIYMKGTFLERRYNLKEWNLPEIKRRLWQGCDIIFQSIVLYESIEDYLTPNQKKFMLENIERAADITLLSILLVSMVKEEGILVTDQPVTHTLKGIARRARKYQSIIEPIHISENISISEYGSYSSYSSLILYISEVMRSIADLTRSGTDMMTFISSFGDPTISISSGSDDDISFDKI